MAESQWPFSDSEDDDNKDFEGFTAEELTNLRPLEEDEQSDISVESYYSSSEAESSEYESDEDNSSDDGAGDDHDGQPALPQTWTEQLSTSVIEDFVEHPGPNTVLEASKKEIDFFHLLFTEDLYELIARETNKYAEQLQQRNGKQDTYWQPTDAAEIRTFIGMRIYMSVVNLPTMKMYWSEDKLFGNFGIAEVMSRARFDKISQYFHVSDRAGYDRQDPARDKLQLVRTILDAVSQTCLNNYTAHRENSVDEAMIKFRGTLGFRQYLPAKPVKYGIKVWVRADSTNGYACEFQVYVGRPHGVRTEVGLGKRVVLDLTQKLAGKRSHIYFDNYFTSVQLLQELLSRNLYGCGTIKSIAVGLPEVMRVQRAKRSGQQKQCIKLQPGESKQWQKGKLLAVMWQENKSRKPVRVLSATTDPIAPLTTVQRKQKDGTSKDIFCPEPIKRYNMFMNGVDRSDQMRMEYSSARSCRRWWTYIFWFLIDLCVSNAFVLINESPNHQLLDARGKNKRTMLEFRKQLSAQLVSGYRRGRKRKRNVRCDVSGAGHWPLKMEKKRTCRKKGCKGESRYICTGCSDVVGKKYVHLCIVNRNCFYEHHTQEDR